MEFFTVEDLADELEIPKRTIQYKVANKKPIPGYRYKKVNGMWFFERIDIDEEVRRISKRKDITSAVKRLARESGLSERTIWNKIKRKREVERRGRGKEQKVLGFRIRTQLPKLVVEEFLRRWLYDPRRTILGVIDDIRNEFEMGILELGIDRWQYSERSFYRVIESIRKRYPEVIDYGKGGRRAVREKIMPVKRDLRAYDVLELVVGDQHVIDYEVIYKGRYVKPQIYMIMDMRSRYITGISVEMGSYNAVAMGRALYRTCLFGIPEGIYVDNGNVELSRYIKGIVEELNKYNGMRITKAIVRNPQAKPIEGFFGHFDKWLYDEMKGIGYVKRGLTQVEADEINRRRKMQRKKGMTYTAEEFITKLYKVIDKWNRHIIAEEGMSPEEIFSEGLSVRKRRRALKRLNEESLRYIFFEKEERTVRQCMVRIRLHNKSLEYYSEDLYGYSGKKIIVAYDRNDIDRVYFFDKEEMRYIGEGQLWSKIDPRDEEELREKMQIKYGYILRVERLWKELIGRKFVKEVNTIHRFDHIRSRKNHKKSQDLEKDIINRLVQLG